MLEQRRAERLQFGPWRNELRSKHDLWHSAKGGGRGEK